MFSAIILLSTFFSLTINQTNTNATTYSATISTSTSLSIDASSVGNGTSVGVDNLTVTSTCPSGYNITIEGPSDTNLYLNGDSSNNASGTYITHSTGTPANPATITGANKGTWGYSTTSSTGSGTFIGLTNTATNLFTKSSASTSGGDSIPVYYGVSIPEGLAPGIYRMPGTSAITYYLTRSDNCVSYSVAFNANGGSGTTMPSQRIYEDVATPLSTNTYTAPTGKIFKEWNTAADGTGTSYADEESVTNIATVGTTLQLYAIWITPIYMQDMSFNQCTTTPMTVYDNRDMQEYTVAKLADGNCWMTKNLNLAGGTKLDSNNSDVPSGYTQSNPYYTLPASASISSDTSIPSDQFSDSSTAYVFNTGNNTTDCNSDTPCNSYYSWLAATAGGKDSDGSSITAAGYNAAYSICPKGWRLPTATTSNANANSNNNWKTGDWYTLATAYGADLESDYYENAATFYTNAGPGTTPDFLVAGRYEDGTLSNSGTVGYYWSSTAVSSTSAYFMYFHSGFYRAANNSGRRLGLSIRCLKEDPSLYKKVEKMSKGKQTNDNNSTTGIKTSPTAPTSSTTISPNSGVYEYDSSVFGEDTDSTKSDGTKAKIYYYRGILDSYGNTNTNGSAGKSDAYPNYVILQAGDSKATTDTCWRIIRTTGSGGVKMIYNGLWTGSTCANATTSAMISSPVSTSTFDGSANNTTTSRQIVRVGYTYNNTYANTSTTSGTAFETVMGSNSNYSVNSTDSTIKENIEAWYNDTISDFEDILEPNAGYCNDRLGYTSNTSTATLTTSIRPYTTSTTSGATYNSYFAGYHRNLATTLSPSLGCSSARSTVDVYSTDTSKGGNGQLNAPVGLLTADEASFAGSGSNTATNGSGFSSNSYLKNGSTFWTMTPYYRYSRYAYNIYMNANGYMTYGRIDSAYGVRPVVSLKEGTSPTSGTGIATDPWVVTIPVPDPISCDSNKICYAPNSYDNSVVGTMGQQNATANTETILLASNYSREGYGFAGWNTEPDYTGTFYGPQQTIKTPSNMSSGLPLYAVWVKSKGYFQNASKVASVCNSLTTAPTNGTANLSSVSALTDERDNETYAIAKLADGQCWMIENLRLESTNSDNTTGALAQGYGTSATYGNFSGLAEPETSNFTATTGAGGATAATTPNSLYYAGTKSGTATINIGQIDFAGFRMPRYNNYNHQATSEGRPQNPNANNATNSTTNAGMYSYGNYYTWAASIADTSNYNTNNQSVTNTSLCPKGWRLPQGGDKTKITSDDDNDFWNLTVDYLNGGITPANYDSSTEPFYNGSSEASQIGNMLRSYPNNFLYSGYYGTSSANGRGSYGYYRTSTASSGSYYSYILSLQRTMLDPGTASNTKESGASVRCLAQ